MADLPVPASYTRRAVMGTAVGAATVATLAACAPQGTTSAGGASPAKSGPVKLSEIQVGGAVSSSHDGSPVLISQPTAGEVVAFSAICTHMGCVVAPASGMFQCPCHGSEFNSRTGAVIQGPATKPLPKLTATVRNGEVSVS
jgi:Rieske Fe-S protein